VRRRLLLVRSWRQRTGERTLRNLRRGVDLSLSWAQLGKSPAQRLDEWVAMHDFAEAAARARARGQVRRAQKKPGRAEEC